MGVAVEPPQPFTWWTTHPLAKVKPLDPVPSAPVKSVDLYAGRNEFEPFQIVLRAKSKDLSGVDIDFSDFRTAEGAEISGKNVTVYLEEFVNLKRPSSIEGGEGLWPDPLIPRVDRYANEARNAFPFTVRRGRNQPLWVEIFVPVAASGKIHGLGPHFSRWDSAVFRADQPDRVEVRPPFHFHSQVVIRSERNQRAEAASWPLHQR